jgi:hypothetical protein
MCWSEHILPEKRRKVLTIQDMSSQDPSSHAVQTCNAIEQAMPSADNAIEQGPSSHDVKPSSALEQAMPSASTHSVFSLHEIGVVLVEENVGRRPQGGEELNQMQSGGDTVPITTQPFCQDSNAIVFDTGAGADAATSSEDDASSLSSEDTGNEEERMQVVSLASEAFAPNTQMAETSNQIRDLLLLLRTQVKQLGLQRENFDLETDTAQVGPQTLNHNHHREEYLLEARSRHEGAHRPHAPKPQSRYF